jgi:hypothetical protein
MMNINPNMLMQFMNFKNSFQGNPQQAVQQMLQSGQVTPQQYQNAVNMAQQLQGMLTPNTRGWR